MNFFSNRKKEKAAAKAAKQSETPPGPADTLRPPALNGEQAVVVEAVKEKKKKKVFPLGLKELHSSDNDVVDIVFIHGLTGDREKTWTAKGDKAPWPGVLLPKIPALSRARILTYGYDASVTDWKTVVSKSRLGEHARTLLSRLAGFRNRDDTNQRPIIFVVHSLGGLVCEDMLFASSTNPELHLRSIVEHTFAIAFMGTPQRGSSFAPWAKGLAQVIGLIKQTNPEILRVLQQDSETLARLKDGFFEMLRGRSQAPIQFTCFYEELPLDVLGSCVVDMDSATIEGYTKIGIHANHMDMTKFSTNDDPGFVDVSDELIRPLAPLNHGASQAEPIKHEEKPMLLRSKTRRTYHHEPLSGPNTIRLVVIEPGRGNDPLRCIMVATIIDTPISSRKAQRVPGEISKGVSGFFTKEYKALVYYWGQEPPECEILISPALDLIESPSSLSAIYVRPNLHAFLQHVRHPHSELTLWVDALCVDQENAEEKSHQLAMLPDIFYQATNTYIFLGHGNPQLENSFVNIPDILHIQRLEEQLENASQDLYNQWLGLWELMQSPILTRRWTVHDILVSKKVTVQYGSHRVTWNDFSDAISIFVHCLDNVRLIKPSTISTSSEDSLPLDATFCCANILVRLVQHTFRKSAGGVILERLLEIDALVLELTPFTTLDARDIIYSVFIMARPSEENSEIPQPDYKESIAEAYIAFVEYFIGKSSSLDILCHHWAPEKAEYTRAMFQSGPIDRAAQQAEINLPSWISTELGAYSRPSNGHQKTAFVRMNGDSLVGPPGKPFYSTHNNMKADAEIVRVRSRDVAPEENSNPGRLPHHFWNDSLVPFQGYLRARGHIVDAIGYIGSRTTRGLIPRECLIRSGLSSSFKDNNISVPEHIWRTLVANRGMNGTVAPIWYRRACVSWLSQHPAGDLDVEEYINRGKPGMVKEYLKRVWSVIFNRRFVLTRGNDNSEIRFGLVPSETMEGDLICVLFGCSVPVVLRQDGSDNAYRMIGECYLHGIMEGEFIEHQRKVWLSHENSAKSSPGEDNDIDQKLEEGMSQQIEFHIY